MFSGLSTAPRAIRAVILTRQQLPVHVRKTGPVRLHL